VVRFLSGAPSQYIAPVPEPCLWVWIKKLIDIFTLKCAALEVKRLFWEYIRRKLFLMPIVFAFIVLQVKTASGANCFLHAVPCICLPWRNHAGPYERTPVDR
jgi:hypothetical protein